MLRIVLADDHEVVRRGLRELLEEHTGWEVCGEAANGRQAVELALRLHPDVAVLDLGMPELNGIEATRQIRRELPETEVLIYSMHESEQLIGEVLAAGAKGYILKSDAVSHLVAAIEALAQHQPFFTGRVSLQLLDEHLKVHAVRQNKVRNGSLSAREREIVQMLAEGKTNQEIAGILTISPKTVETHRAAIMRKLGLNSIVELVRYAVRNQIIEA